MILFDPFTQDKCPKSIGLDHLQRWPSKLVIPANKVRSESLFIARPNSVECQEACLNINYTSVESNLLKYNFKSEFKLCILSFSRIQ